MNADGSGLLGKSCLCTAFAGFLYGSKTNILQKNLIHILLQNDICVKAVNSI